MKTNKDGFVQSNRIDKRREYYGEWGWLTITEANKLFNETLSKFMDDNPLRFRKIRGFNDYQNKSPKPTK